jgi:hypothetical protein
MSKNHILLRYATPTTSPYVSKATDKGNIYRDMPTILYTLINQPETIQSQTPDADPNSRPKERCMLWYHMRPKNLQRTPGHRIHLICPSQPSVTVVHGHVKLLVLLLSPMPSNSPLMCFGTLALAQHCIATRLMSSTSSSRNLNCRFASLLFRSLTPFSSTAWPDVTKGTVGCVNRRFEPGRSLVVVVGEETRDSRFTHSRIRAWMPADNWEARERM